MLRNSAACVVQISFRTVHGRVDVLDGLLNTGRYVLVGFSVYARLDHRTVSRVGYRTLEIFLSSIDEYSRRNVSDDADESKREVCDRDLVL